MYIEHVKELGVSYTWHDATVIDSIVTHRGTLVEMVERPNFGLSCFMDNSIQSCLSDEKLYHEALVHRVMSDSVKNVLILGGGEGATAREVLKWPVERVDMVEWDKDVVEFFKKYPQWSQGAWDDKRLHIHYEDVFQWKPSILYDAIIVDLFELDENFNIPLFKWIKPNGAIVMYAGTNLDETKLNMYAEMWRGIPIYPTYKVYIPSFLGESVFFLFT